MSYSRYSRSVGPLRGTAVWRRAGSITERVLPAALPSAHLSLIQPAQNGEFPIWRKGHFSWRQDLPIAPSAEKSLHAIVEPLTCVRKMRITAPGKGKAERLPGGTRFRTVDGQQLLQSARVRVDKLARVHHEAVHHAPEAGAIAPAVLGDLVGRYEPWTRRTGASCRCWPWQKVLPTQGLVCVVVGHSSHIIPQLLYICLLVCLLLASRFAAGHVPARPDPRTQLLCRFRPGTLAPGWACGGGSGGS